MHTNIHDGSDINHSNMHVAGHQKGFSLVEMLVAVALFSMVVLMSLAAMTTLLDANKKARSLKLAVDNVNFVLDDIARNIRQGSKFFCQSSVSSPINVYSADSRISTRDCTYAKNDLNSGGSYLGFRDKDLKWIFYRFDGNANPKCLRKKTTTDSWGAYEDNFSIGYNCITPTELAIDRFRFYVYNSGAVNKQPYVVIAIQGTAGGVKQSTQVQFSLMTSISQRLHHDQEDIIEE